MRLQINCYFSKWCILALQINSDDRINRFSQVQIALCFSAAASVKAPETFYWWGNALLSACSTSVTPAKVSGDMLDHNNKAQVYCVPTDGITIFIS